MLVEEGGQTQLLRNMAISTKARQTIILLAKSNPKTIKKILKKADSGLIRALSEISLNILNGVIPLSKDKKKKMARFKNNLRTMVHEDKISIKKKTAQRGGFIGILARIALPLLVSGISAAIKSRKSKKK